MQKNIALTAALMTLSFPGASGLAAAQDQADADEGACLRDPVDARQSAG